MNLYLQLAFGSGLILFGILIGFLAINQGQLSSRLALLENAAAQEAAKEEASNMESDLVEYAREQVRRISCLYESGPVLVDGAGSLTDLPRGYWECEEPFSDRRIVLSKFGTAAQGIESECAYAFRISKSDTIRIYPSAQREFGRVLDICNRYFELRGTWGEMSPEALIPSPLVLPQLVIPPDDLVPDGP